LRSSVTVRTLLVLGLLALAGGTALLASRGVLAPHALEQAIAGHPLAPLVFTAMCVAASLVGVPRTLFGLVAGLLFGLWWGLLWITVASTLGSLVGFLLVRYINAGLVDPSRLRLLAPTLAAAERGGWRTVALIRIVPYLPHTPVNYALALTRVSLISYAVGSLLGMIPSSFVAVQLGATGKAALTGRDWVVPVAVSLLLLALSVVLPRLPAMRRWMRLAA
jgi:uncharacterized membrane protein YdjX (TVP38/TMEM64 family)